VKLLWSITTLAVILLISPLVLVFFKGMAPSALQALWADTQTLRAAAESLGLALATAIITTFLGSFIAYSLPSLPPWMRRFVNRGLIFPMVLPEIALGLSYMVWFVKWGVPFGWGTLLSAHVAFSLSYATLIMKIRFEVLDNRIVDAAKDLGAGGFSLVRHAYWPQIAPGVFSSFVTCFALSVDDFLVSFFVKGIEQNLLPIRVFSMMRIRIGPELYALSFVLFCVSMATVLVTQIWLRDRKKEVAL